MVKRLSQLCDALSSDKKLSYRKQIARKLRTQYVEGIYNNFVTFKPKLRVRQGHWKRNHWIDHIGLTIIKLFDV